MGIRKSFEKYSVPALSIDFLLGSWNNLQLHTEITGLRSGGVSGALLRVLPGLLPKKIGPSPTAPSRTTRVIVRSYDRVVGPVESKHGQSFVFISRTLGRVSMA
jgi:hypothetical protein